MRDTTIARLMTFLALVGILCAAFWGQTAKLNTPKATAPKYSEAVSYLWSDYRVIVEFHRLSPTGAWTISVRDSWLALDQSEQKGKVWDLSASRCSREQCLALIDDSLTRFEADKPGSKVESLVMDMQIDRNLWAEILGIAKETLSGMGGRNPGGPFFPDRVISSMLHTGEDSTTFAELKAVLAKHGLTARDFGFAEPPTLRKTLSGRSWREISRLPDEGIGVPPLMDVDLH
jgi:hypothetical protein